MMIEVECVIPKNGLRNPWYISIDKFQETNSRPGASQLVQKVQRSKHWTQQQNPKTWPIKDLENHNLTSATSS